VGKASGSMMRATAKVPLTGIRGLPRSSTRPPHGKPLKLETLSVAARIRADRIYHEAAEIVGALTAVETVEASTVAVVAGNQPPSEEVAKALLVEVSGAVKQGRQAAVVVQAAGVPEGDLAVVVLVAAAEEAVAVVVAVVDDDKHWVKIINIVDDKFDGGESDAY